MPFPIGGPLEVSVTNGFRDIQWQCDAMVTTCKQRSRSFISDAPFSHNTCYRQTTDGWTQPYIIIATLGYYRPILSAKTEFVHDV